MTLIETTLLKCPVCCKHLCDIRFDSFTVLDSEQYSDGVMMSNPPMPEDTGLRICHYCDSVFWVENNTIETNKLVDETQSAHKPADLFIKNTAIDKLNNALFHLDLLEKNIAETIEKEIAIRLYIWQKLNDVYRFELKFEDAKLKMLFLNVFTNNLEKLKQIYKPQYEMQTLLYAEMYRESGEYEKAINIITEINDKSFCFSYDEILEKCKQKNSLVFKISD